MGEIIGGVLGGVGDVAGSIIQANAAQQAVQQALTGYNYLSSSPYISTAAGNGTAANNAEAQLLGLQGVTPQTKTAFDNYLKSTGYNFQLNSGDNAIESTAGAKGLLNSGGTAKALMKYGQDLGSTYFNNYLTNLNNMNAGGYNAVAAVGNAGTGAGSTAAQYTAAGGDAIAGGLAGGLGNLSNIFASGSILGGRGANL